MTTSSMPSRVIPLPSQTHVHHLHDPWTADSTRISESTSLRTRYCLLLCTEPPMIQSIQCNLSVSALKSASPDMADHRCSECGIEIKKECESQYGLEAIRWMLNWAFRNANLHRVECNVFGWNTGIQKIYKSLGFFEEGKRRECLFKDDKWWDEVHLGILKEEWQLIGQ
ncbi:unnamed protein product [Penicillium egyptiacum]|uniref:N-acetyltransferase domain-containing protein n=1 Tax=Penicillium egyptiacum TaxID=1303716 RepID=A0A9W4KKC0_9EURO|nr:unnamed protein product [Penicillium egyptiacum]